MIIGAAGVSQINQLESEVCGTETEEYFENDNVEEYI